MNIFIEWLKHNMLTCPSKHFFHIDCPGCGLQRSIIDLLEGNLVESFKMYPATVPMLFCLIFAALHIKFKFKYGAEIIKIAFVFTASVILIFYVYKIFTHQLV
jgi:hypothetical protein